MKQLVFSVRDSKVGFMPPVVDQSEASAIRNFKYAMSNHDSLMGFAPKDFDLYLVAYFDSDSGRFSRVDPIKLVANGESLLGVN